MENGTLMPTGFGSSCFGFAVVAKCAGNCKEKVIKEHSVVDANTTNTRNCYRREKLFNKVCKYIFLLYQPQDLLT